MPPARSLARCVLPGGRALRRHNRSIVPCRGPARQSGATDAPVPRPVGSVAHLAHDDDLAVAVVEGRTPTGISPCASGGAANPPAGRRAARTRTSWPACVARRRRRAATSPPRTRRCASRIAATPKNADPWPVEADADDRRVPARRSRATSVHETARSARTRGPAPRRAAAMMPSAMNATGTVMMRPRVPQPPPPKIAQPTASQIGRTTTAATSHLKNARRISMPTA